MYTHGTPTSSASYGTIHIQWMRCLPCLFLFVYITCPYSVLYLHGSSSSTTSSIIIIIVRLRLVYCGDDIDSHWLYGCDFRFVARHFAFLNPNKISLRFRTIFIIFNVNTIKSDYWLHDSIAPGQPSTTKRNERGKKFHDVSDYLGGDFAFDSIRIKEQRMRASECVRARSCSLLNTLSTIRK